MLSIAQTISDDPFVARVSTGRTPSDVLQSYAERIRRRTAVASW